MGASVRQRLLNYAKVNNRPFAEVLQYYAMERFLYRLSVSPHASKFLLKGALLLTAWRAPMSRPTMDIDLLGRTSNEVDDIVNLLKNVAQTNVPDDGITFDLDSFVGSVIREDADYSGVRTVFTGHLNAARVAACLKALFASRQMDSIAPSTATALVSEPSNRRNSCAFPGSPKGSTSS
jgi:hypothetical protein